MGKFFNGKVKPSKSTLIKYGMVGGGILLILLVLILLTVSKNNAKKNIVLTLKENIKFEINDDYPKAVDFFKEIKNYDKNDLDINYNDLDMTEVGKYTVIISAKGAEDKEIPVEVVDTRAPVLTLKNNTIKIGGTYEINDFVESCEDNSEKDCIIEYYTETEDLSGKKVDYSSFRSKGTYIIKIVASDETGNKTEVQSTKLFLGTVDTANCTYGDLTFDASTYKFPLAITVGDENDCAVNKDLWNDENVQVNVNKYYQEDWKKLQAELTPILQQKYGIGKLSITAEPHFLAIMNEKGSGLVGYGIYVKVYVSESSEDIKNENNLKVAYYLKDDKTRTYERNDYDLK